MESGKIHLFIQPIRTLWQIIFQFKNLPTKIKIQHLVFLFCPILNIVSEIGKQNLSFTLQGIRPKCFLTSPPYLSWNFAFLFSSRAS